MTPDLDALLDALADRIVERLTAGTRADMVDQHASPLGRRRHIAAARRRVTAGEGGAAIVGRRHMLTRTALDAELASTSKRRRARKLEPMPAVDDLAELRERLGIERKGAV